MSRALSSALLSMVSWHQVNGYLEWQSVSTKRHRGRIALALVSFAVVLCITELALRIGPRRSTQGLRGLHQVRADRPWLFGLRPGARSTIDTSGEILYEVNADGFRDRRYAKPKPPGTFRIVVLGDSLTFGYRVAQDETYPKVMEARIAGRTEVLNFGINGYNPYNEAALFGDVGVHYQPDLVLVQFCTNDLNDPTLHFDRQTLLHLGTIPDAAYPDPSQRSSRSPRWLLSSLQLCRRSRLCALADDALIRWRATTPEPPAAMASLLSLDEFPPGSHRDWLMTHYAHIAERAASIGSRFAVLAFPFRAQLEGEASERIQEQLVALGVEGGWVTIDLLPAFRDARARGSEPLFLDIWHLSAAGHRAAADAIVTALDRQGFLPEVGGG